MSLTAHLIKAVSRRVIKRDGLDHEQLTRHLRRHFNHTPTIRLLPSGVRCRQLEARGFEGDVVSVKAPTMAVLYTHGGAYIAGITRTYHNLAGKLAKQLNAAVYLPRYPFAPENPFPAGVNRILEGYRFLLDEGYSADNIAIGGDSAGGGLSLALLLAIRDNNLPMPRCAFLFSPGTNGFTDGESVHKNNASDAMLSADMVQRVAEIYIPDAKDRSHPYASPGFADYNGLPPLFISVARDEVLYSDAVAARSQAMKANVPVHWLERDGLFHVWPIMVPFLKEARQDTNTVIDFIRQPRASSG
ncbi:MAG: alpha/beta hydrolase [Gammaproteobacteria bacterium HGW-Gammaproteobacteria-14]|nr:MAG: alpha/beta hydrolase [Gammaproteobacteria bacterium HGW-Gammaproteobacteria-14]